MNQLKVTSVAIHQPNFFPWIGYFNKIFNSDVFIFLDDVQLQKKAGSWTNRVKILVNGNAQWLTMPIRRVSGSTQNINETSIADLNWLSRCLEIFDRAYKKAPFHAETMLLLISLLEAPTSSLSEFNQNTIIQIYRYLDLDEPQIVKSSELQAKSRATDRLVDLISAVGGNQYICGGGSESYLEPCKFVAEGIVLLMQEYEQIPYPQLKTSKFIPGLSIVDSLMMLGPQSTSQLVRKQVRD
jgi:hypothetical protein